MLYTICTNMLFDSHNQNQDVYFMVESNIPKIKRQKSTRMVNNGFYAKKKRKKKKERKEEKKKCVAILKEYNHHPH